MQVICRPRIIIHASMYHRNPSPWSYTPPHNCLTTKQRHIIQCPNTSEHFLIATNHTTTTTPHFRTFPPLLPTSPPCCNTSSFHTHEPIRKYHRNRSVVIWAVIVFPSQVWPLPRAFPKGPGFLGYRWWNLLTAGSPFTNFTGSNVRESYPLHSIRYCNKFRYTRLSSALDTWYSSPPSTSTDSGGSNVCPTTESFSTGSRSEKGCTGWICIDEGKCNS